MNLLINKQLWGVHLYTCKASKNVYVCLDDKLSRYNKVLKIQVLHKTEVCFSPVAGAYPGRVGGSPPHGHAGSQLLRWIESVSLYTRLLFLVQRD